MKKLRLTISEVADFDHGHRDPARTSEFSIDSFDFKGRGDMRTRMVPGHYADNPMYDSSKLTEDDDEGMLDRLHAMLKAADIGDDEIEGEVRLTPEGMRKVAAKLGVTEDEVGLLLNSLATRLRKDRDNDLTAAYESTMGTRDRYSTEDDYLGNVTVRDGTTGQSKFLRGSHAANLRQRMKGADKQDVLATVFESAGKIKAERAFNDVYRLRDGEKIVGLAMKLSNGRWSMNDPNEKRIGKRTFSAPKDVASAWNDETKGTPLKEDAASAERWDIQSGPVTYNFPWNRGGEHGTATAKFSSGAGEHTITLIQARDNKGRKMDLDDALRAHLEDEARDFIGRE